MTLAENKCKQLRTTLAQLQEDLTAGKTTLEQVQQENTEREKTLNESALSIVQQATDAAATKCRSEVTELEAMVKKNDLVFKSTDKNSKVLDAAHVSMLNSMLLYLADNCYFICRYMSHNIS